MKKWIALVLALACVLTLAGCGTDGEEPGEDREAEAAALAGENEEIPTGNVQQAAVARIGRGRFQTAAALSEEDADWMVRLLEEASWNAEGTADCLNDCILTVNGESVYYHSDCGTFNDEANQRSLTLTDEEQTAVNTVLSKYITLGLDIFEDEWGVALTAKDVTPTGLTLVAAQSGGAPTGELATGSRFWLEEYRNGVWEAAPELPLEDGVERAWDDVAYLIPMDDSVEWEVSWEWIYGELPAGTYRIGKEIMDFRGTGDYDTQNYYAQFTIAD